MRPPANFSTKISNWDVVIWTDMTLCDCRNVDALMERLEVSGKEIELLAVKSCIVPAIR